MNKKPIYGVGINDANYPISNCIFYKKWQHMLMRCFSSVYHKTHPSYIGTSVCDEWLIFTVFREWMLSQDWKNKQLDKDLIKKGNKHYSPELCCFIPQSINLLFNENTAKGNSYGKGVSITDYGKFQSRLSKEHKKIYLGVFDTAQEAENAYLKAKSDYLMELANENIGIIRDGLIQHANYYSSLVRK